MLASLLPGLRDLRAPLAAGYLWLLLGWLALGGVIPKESDATGALDRVYALQGPISAFGIGIALSFAAYIIGALSEALTGPADRWLNRPFISERARRSIELVVEQRLRDLASRVPLERLQYELQEQLRGQFAVREKETPDVRFGQLILVLQQRIRQELDLAATRLIGEQSELFSTIDRLRAEAEFRFAIVPPLVALTVFLAVTETIAWLPCLAAIGVLGWQGVDRKTKANDVVVDSLLLNRVEAPTLERLRKAVSVSDEETAGGGATTAASTEA